MLKFPLIRYFWSLYLVAIHGHTPVFVSEWGVSGGSQWPPRVVPVRNGDLRLVYSHGDVQLIAARKRWQVQVLLCNRWHTGDAELKQILSRVLNYKWDLMMSGPASLAVISFIKNWHKKLRLLVDLQIFSRFQGA